MTDTEIINQAMRLLEAKRPRTEHHCAACGKTFQGIRSARYCGNTCKVAGYRARKRRETQTPS